MENIDTSVGIINTKAVVDDCMEYLSKAGVDVKNKKDADLDVNNMAYKGMHTPLGLYTKSWTKSDAKILESVKYNAVFRGGSSTITYVKIFCVLYTKRFIWEQTKKKSGIDHEYGTFNNTVYYITDKTVRIIADRLIVPCRNAHFDTILEQRSPEHYLNLYHLGFYNKKRLSYHAIPFFYYCKQKSKLDYKIVSH